MSRLFLIVLGLMVGTALFNGDGGGVLPTAWVAYRDQIAALLLAVIVLPLLSPWFK